MSLGCPECGSLDACKPECTWEACHPPVGGIDADGRRWGYASDAELVRRLLAPKHYVGIPRTFAELIEAARDAADRLASLSRQEGWRPIESAPKDGREIVVAYGHQGFVKQLVWFDRLHGYWSSKGKPQPGLETNATHWMPLPSPPPPGA